VKLTEKTDVHEQIYDAAVVGRLFALSGHGRKWGRGKAAVLANLRADQTVASTRKARSKEAKPFCCDGPQSEYGAQNDCGVT
jgi:hypothetical protein